MPTWLAIMVGVVGGVASAMAVVTPGWRFMRGVLARLDRLSHIVDLHFDDKSELSRQVGGSLPFRVHRLEEQVDARLDHIEHVLENIDPPTG